MGRYAPLRFLRADQVPRRPGDVVFRQARLANSLVFVISLLLTLGLLLSPILPLSIPGAQPVPVFVPYLAAPFTALFAFVGWRTSRSGFRPSNWIVRSAPEGLYVKFRSYLNHGHSTRDPVVLFVPKAEVASIRAHHEKTRRPVASAGGSDREEVVRRRYLEIGLRDPRDVAELAEHLARERARWEPGFAGTRMKFQHYPVRALPEGVVRIDWAGPHSSIRPRLSKATAILGRVYRVAGPAESAQRPAADLGPEEQEERLIEMIGRGEKIPAVKLAARLYDLDTTEAVRFVETLRGGPAAADARPARAMRSDS